jgi:hypothetical protein
MKKRYVSGEIFEKIRRATIKRWRTDTFVVDSSEIISRLA